MPLQPFTLAQGPLAMLYMRMFVRPQGIWLACLAMVLSGCQSAKFGQRGVFPPSAAQFGQPVSHAMPTMAGPMTAYPPADFATLDDLRRAGCFS